MSRWGRGRSGSVAVPLDSALFRENSNYPTAARSAGTVGKWGVTSFTSIRSAPYAYASTAAKKPVQDQNSPLTVPAVETEQPPPKPKKFFKSRNAEAYPPVPQITYAPPALAAPLSPDHLNKEKKLAKRSRIYNRDSSSPELPRRASDKGKAKKSVATKAAKKEDVSVDNTQPPNKRYLVRNRNKVINYAEDGSNSPIPDFSRYESLPSTASKVVPEVREKVPSPMVSPPLTSPSIPKPDVESPSTSKDSNEERKPPPIVLRISKGTSRIVSTDSNEGFTSPSSDRHSSMDTHSDYGFDHKKSPSMETICSPRQEGLKITIKCGGLTQEGKKEKKKEKKEHKHKKYHKSSDDEPLINKKITSPVPTTDVYELNKTQLSPMHTGKEKEIKPAIDEIESQLAQLDAGPAVPKTPLFETRQPLVSPDPKPPESTTGRSRRARQVINYSENDDVVEKLTSAKLNKPIKTVSDLKRESKKHKKKQEAASNDAVVFSEVLSETEKPESHLDNNDLIDILSGGEGKSSIEPYKPKIYRKQKNKHVKHHSPEHDNMDEQADDPPSPTQEERNMDSQTNETGNTLDCHNQPHSSGESVTNDDNCEEKISEYESKKHDEFKSPSQVDTDEHSEDKPSVKLVITKKKGSIFKSKSLVSDNDASPLPARKRRHLYRHEWANDKGNETPRPEPAETPEVRNTINEVPEELTRVTRYREPDPIVEKEIKPYTSVKCSKEAKEYYTVVRNVKTAHQIQEIGEFQEFNDDVEYLLDALQHNNPISTRCLSAITLATKCTAPAFRMHVRAHGTVQKFFSALHDATNDQRLGLCTATVMFVLSQDRLNMDLDRESLELMLNLLESDASHKNALDDCGLTSAQLTKTQERVRELCAEIKSQGKAKHLDLDNITVGHLAMETLLSLTSKRAGEWFKEELRVLGGVDHIVRTIQDCSEKLESPSESWTSADIDILRKADRCMRVLENVTQMNEDNQLYLLSEQLGAARLLGSLLCRCVREAAAGAQQVAAPQAGQGSWAASRRRRRLLDAALPAVKVLVNLSHSFNPNATSLGAQVIGAQTSVMEICLIMLDNQDNFIPDDNNFDFSVCVLMLLTNLVQHNEENSQRLLSTRVRRENADDIISRSVTALELLVELFYKRVDLARRAEENTDALLDGKEKDTEQEKDKKKQSAQDDIDETVAKLLARAGSHMEHTMVGAYTALLLGHMAICSRSCAEEIKTRLPTYEPVLPTLKKYYTFLELTASAEQAIVAHVKSTHRIIQYMENCLKEGQASTTEPNPEPAAPYNTYPGQYYQTSPSDVPQDMSLSNLNYSYSNSSSDRMSSSIDSYH